MIKYILLIVSIIFITNVANANSLINLSIRDNTIEAYFEIDPRVITTSINDYKLVQDILGTDKQAKELLLANIYIKDCELFSVNRTIQVHRKDQVTTRIWATYNCSLYDYIDVKTTVFGNDSQVNDLFVSKGINTRLVQLTSVDNHVNICLVDMDFSFVKDAQIINIGGADPVEVVKPPIVSNEDKVVIDNKIDYNLILLIVLLLGFGVWFCFKYKI